MKGMGELEAATPIAPPQLAGRRHQISCKSKGNAVYNLKSQRANQWVGMTLVALTSSHNPRRGKKTRRTQTIQDPPPHLHLYAWVWQDNKDHRALTVVSNNF